MRLPNEYDSLNDMYGDFALGGNPYSTMPFVKAKSLLHQNDKYNAQQLAALTGAGNAGSQGLVPVSSGLPASTSSAASGATGAGNPAASSSTSSITDLIKPVADVAKSFKPAGQSGTGNGPAIDLKGLFDKGAGSKFGYNFKGVVGDDGKRRVGVQAFGKNLGKAFNIGNAAVQTAKVAKGLSDVSKTRGSSEDLASDIVLSAANSPTIGYDLSADQMKLLRELQNGTYDSKANLGDINLLGALGGAAKGALTGIAGGLPGMIIGGVGGLANSVVGDIKGDADRDSAELEALYQAVQESEQQHNAMRKQRAYNRLYGGMV